MARSATAERPPSDGAKKKPRFEAFLDFNAAEPLWQKDIVEITGHNVEAHGREEVNRLLQQGWILLHLYTLKYEENGTWRERPMAILGKPRAAAAREPI